MVTRKKRGRKPTKRLTAHEKRIVKDAKKAKEELYSF
jgi:hypothetical protein